MHTAILYIHGFLVRLTSLAGGGGGGGGFVAVSQSKIHNA